LYGDSDADKLKAPVASRRLKPVDIFHILEDKYTLVAGFKIYDIVEGLSPNSCSKIEIKRNSDLRRLYIGANKEYNEKNMGIQKRILILKDIYQL
jgi:hypothetical protein